MRRPAKRDTRASGQAFHKVCALFISMAAMWFTPVQPPHFAFNQSRGPASLVSSCYVDHYNTAGIRSTLPAGVPSAPMDANFTKDPDLGVIWGNHPDAEAKDFEKLHKIVRKHKSSAFAYSVAELGC